MGRAAISSIIIKCSEKVLILSIFGPIFNGSVSIKFDAKEYRKVESLVEAGKLGLFDCKKTLQMDIWHKTKPDKSIFYSWKLNLSGFSSEVFRLSGFSGEVFKCSSNFVELHSQSFSGN